jgi:prevent-host-death family protein
MRRRIYTTHVGGQRFSNAGVLMEKELGITQARIEFNEIVEQVQHRGDIYIINRHGKPAAALVPVQVYETWKRQRRQFFDQIRELEAQAGLEPEKAERPATQAVASIRAESQSPR